MNPFDSYLRTRLGRRAFLKMSGLAAVAGAAASFTGMSSARTEDSAIPGSTARPYAGSPRSAQYGRARGRYPVAERGGRSDASSP